MTNDAIAGQARVTRYDRRSRHSRRGMAAGNTAGRAGASGTAGRAGHGTLFEAVEGDWTGRVITALFGSHAIQFCSLAVVSRLQDYF